MDLHIFSRFGKFSTIISLNMISAPFALPSSSGIPVTPILAFLMEPDNSNVPSLLKNLSSQGAWVAQSVECPTSAQVMVSSPVSLSPTSGSVLTAHSLESVSDSVSPSLSAPPPLVFCLSLKNKYLKIFFLNLSSPLFHFNYFSVSMLELAIFLPYDLLYFQCILTHSLSHLSSSSAVEFV